MHKETHCFFTKKRTIKQQNIKDILLQATNICKSNRNVWAAAEVEYL